MKKAGASLHPLICFMKRQDVCLIRLVGPSCPRKADDIRCQLPFRSKTNPYYMFIMRRYASMKPMMSPSMTPDVFPTS